MLVSLRYAGELRQFSLVGNYSIPPKLSPTLVRLLTAVNNAPNITTQDLAIVLGRSVPVTRVMLRRLHYKYNITINLQGGPTYE